ncbi:MAG: HD domain-containing protein, partial [Elusimicrobia bacterium]|nr:HD domain-containing protein [Elusimicrobiota bacterium]
MKTKNKILLKKIVSITVSFFLFNSVILNNFAYAIPVQQMMPIAQNNNILKTTIDSSVAYITDSFNSASNKNNLLFFIQDLHTNPSVQKNISKILEQLDKQYGIDRIYMEGLPAGKANTSVLDSLKKYNLSDKLINKNIITGTEYYFLNNTTTAQIYGLEDWNKYLANIKRAAQILQDQDYIIQTYNSFKEDLFANINDIKKVEKYINFNLADDKILKITNQPILKYNELHKYISLSDNINNLNLKKVSEEHKLFIADLKSKLQVSLYNDIINLSKKENLKEYYSVLYNILVKNNDYRTRYKNLNKLLEYSLQKSQLNIVNLISQQNKYFNDYLSSISNDKFQQDMFVVKMTQIFQDFLTLSISDENYNFFVENYQKYINLLPKYLSQNYDKYTDLLFYDIIFDYHKINKDRNTDFIKNISIDLKNKQDNKVTVVIAGGFHSSILETFKKEKYSYFLITPNIDQAYNTDFYDEMILSSISDNVESNALAPIRELLTNPNIIPKETVILFTDSLINALIDKSDVSPKELKDIITSIAREKIVINIPLTIEITESKFIVNIYGKQVIYKIENNKVIWQSVSIKHTKKKTRDLSAKVVAKAKRKFNILEATSLQLNPNSIYASKFISRRKGTKRNFMFSLSMLFSSLKLNDLAYDLMMGFASLNKNKTTKISIDFDTDFGEEVKKLKEFSGFKGKKLDITIENGLNKYLSREDLLNILAASISRLDTRAINFKDGIFIGYLDKSTNLFEDHLNNGFIGVNAGVFQIKDEDVKKAIIHAGIIHELTHEFKGSLNSLEYDIFEERMMFCDMKFLIEYMAKIEYGKDIDFSSLLYSYEDSSNFDHIVQRIISALTAEIQEPETGKRVPLFTENVRFIRKFQNYKYNIDDISGFIKRKNFSIRERRGQLKHIENEYLMGNDEAQEKLFSSLAVSEEKTDSMEDFLKKHIPEERIEEVTESIEKLIANFKKALYSSDLDPKIIDKKVKEFEQYIYECLHLMYRKMPDYLFGIYYNEQGVIADHALNHSIELLNNAIPILRNNIDKIETLDIKSLVYSAFLHDISCTLIRLNHEQNSATFAKAILQGEMKEEEINKIYDICIGHKKIKNGVLREEHKKYLEARIIHDADGLSAALALDRILGVWLTNKEIFLNKNLTIDERIKLINENKYLMVDGGDAINDLLRQFLRRDRKY